ncbi:MAG: hypothetical protein Q8Q11_01070 [bacterium]|nr:hypothetical protein [bacterium]MDZ4247920.1 hypothetical protein [Patescibacteria group bacterium]
MPRSVEEARGIAEASVDDWRVVPELARRICENGRSDIRHQMAAETGVWPIFHTLKLDAERPSGIGIDCETGLLRAIRRADPTDGEIVDASTPTTAIDGKLVRRLLESHLDT